jgi:hypothetical protein
MCRAVEKGVFAGADFLGRRVAVSMQLKAERLRSRFLRKARREARTYPTAICKRRTTTSLCKKIKQALCFQLHGYGLVFLVFLWLANFSGVLSVSAGESSISSGGNFAPLAHKFQIDARKLAGQTPPKDARLIADYGSYRLYESSGTAAFSANSAAESRDEYNTLLLNVSTLDTSRPEVRALRKPVGGFAGKRMHLVQFAGPVLPEWREALLKSGAQIVNYIPHNAYLVYGDSNAIAQIQSLAGSAPQVQWDGEFLDDYKMDAAVTQAARETGARAETENLFAIQLFADGDANAATLALLDRLKLEPLSRRESILQYVNVVGRFNASDLRRIASQSDVISIHPWRTPRKVCERADQIVAGNLSGGVPSGPGYLAWLASKGFSQAQFTASSFIIDIADSGIDNGTVHPYHFGLHTAGTGAAWSRVGYVRFVGIQNPGSTLKGCDGHGTINAHIIGGYDDLAGFPFEDAAQYHYGLGVCPFAQLGSSVVFDPDKWTYPSYPTLVSGAYHNGARVSNNSWGGNDGAYDIDAQTYDALSRDAEPNGAAFSVPGNQEMVMVFSAGNDGPKSRTIYSPATAKNVIAVGAADGVQPFGGPTGSDAGGIPDTEASDANSVPDFASRGPCIDGRHKPDLVAPGTHVSGGVAQIAHPGPDGTADPCFLADGSGVDGGAGTNGAFNPFFPDGQQFYTASSGSSHSAPCVSGGCALLRQYFVNNSFTPPSPAMTKAYLMNSARYLDGATARGNIWSDIQGMGEIDLGAAFDGAPRILRDQLPADLFTASGQARTFTGVVANANKPFKVTVAWSDAPGSTVSAAYNNDLDLTVTVGGVTYKGNVFNGPWSITGGAADTRDNVESVFLPPGTSGEFEVSVRATSINSIGVPNAANALEQDFALVIYNAGSALINPPAIASPASAFVINTPSLRVSGTGVAGAAVTIFDNGTAVGQGIAGAAGAFSITVKLPDGAHALTATESQFGATSAASGEITGTSILAPEITLQPQSQSAFLQETLTLRAGVFGAAPMQTFWLRNGVRAAGAAGTNLTVTVTPASAANYQFVGANSFGAVTSSIAAINLVPNPFANLAGTCYGLFEETPPRFQSSGSLILNLTTQGKFSGTIAVAGARYAFTGQLAIDGTAAVTIRRPSPLAPLSLTLALDVVNSSQQITGALSDGSFNAPLKANLATFSARNPCPWQGAYSVIFSNAGSGPGPIGTGFGRAIVNASGMVTLTGTLADNTPIAPAAVSLSKDGQWPLYIPLYGTAGAMTGWLTFGSGTAPEGDAAWFKTHAFGTLYPAGFTNVISVTGSRFLVGTALKPVLPPTNFNLTISGGGFTNPVSETVSLRSMGQFTAQGGAVSKLSLALNPATGLVTGSFVMPDGRNTAVIKGVALEGQTNAAGFFLTPQAGGSFELVAP